jgi:hypothetical protein
MLNLCFEDEWMLKYFETNFNENSKWALPVKNGKWVTCFFAVNDDEAKCVQKQVHWLLSLGRIWITIQLSKCSQPQVHINSIVLNPYSEIAHSPVKSFNTSILINNLQLLRARLLSVKNIQRSIICRRISKKIIKTFFQSFPLIHLRNQTIRTFFIKVLSWLKH